MWVANLVWLQLAFSIAVMITSRAFQIMIGFLRRENFNEKKDWYCSIQERGLQITLLLINPASFFVSWSKSRLFCFILNLRSDDYAQENHQRHAIWQNGPKCVWRIWCIWRVYVFEISPKYVDRIWRIYVFDFFLKKFGMPRIWRIWRVYVFDFFPISFNAPYLTYLMCLRIWVFTNKI